MLLTEKERNELAVLRDMLVASFKGANFAGVEIDSLVPALDKICGEPTIRCITNLPKFAMHSVLEAVRVSGCVVEWRDKPDELMSSHPDRDRYGSIWSSENDLAPFWNAYFDTRRDDTPQEAE